MKKPSRGEGAVLCATDLTLAGDEALRRASEVATTRKAPLVVLHVLPDPLRHHPLLPMGRNLRYARLPAAHARASDDVRAQIERAVGRPASNAQIRIEHGVPHAAIIAAAESLRADLIVVGASPLHVGYEAERVVRYAHGPVLVARPYEAAGAVLVATDLSDASFPAVAAGVEWARRHRAALTLLHVFDLRPFMMQPDFGMSLVTPLTTEVRESLLGSARDRLSRALRRFRANGDAQVETGEPATVILEQAARLRIGLLVLGTVGSTGLTRMVLGSVAETVVRQAQCSTLVVRLHRARTRRPR